MDDSIFSMICQKHYAQVFRYSRARLAGDLAGAEAVTYAVFLQMDKELEKVVKRASLLPWLLRMADRKIRTYRRKHPRRACSAAPVMTAEEVAVLLDPLSTEDRRFLAEYCIRKDKQALADQCGISLASLYERARRISEMLRQGKEGLSRQDA